MHEDRKRMPVSSEGMSDKRKFTAPFGRPIGLARMESDYSSLW